MTASLDRTTWTTAEVVELLGLDYGYGHQVPEVEAVSWIIAGGESGPQHRPLEVAHARGLRDQARVLEVPFFFKQHGGQWAAQGGDLLDGARHHHWPGGDDPAEPIPTKVTVR